jgi:hypothetical protein
VVALPIVVNAGRDYLLNEEMSLCRIKRNLVSGCSSGNKEECSKEISDKLQKMIEERKKQDALLNTVLSEKEYEEKYGSQPIASVKK